MVNMGDRCSVGLVAVERPSTMTPYGNRSKTFKGAVIHCTYQSWDNEAIGNKCFQMGTYAMQRACNIHKTTRVYNRMGSIVG